MGLYYGKCKRISKWTLKMTKLFDTSIVSDAESAIDFITNILQASTEYSIIGKDLTGKILLWNEGAKKLYGYTPEEMIGKANSSLLHTPEDIKAQLPQKMMEVALKEGKWEGIIKRIRKDGKQFVAHAVLTPRRDHHGKPVGFLLISKNISQELHLIKQLEETQLYTRSLIESNIDALVTTDPLGVIQDVNQEMQKLSGFSRKELVGSPFKNYFTDPERAEKGIREVLQEGKVSNYELTLVAKNGYKTAVSYNASTFHDAAGKLEGVFVAARDITEQKKLEQQLRESQMYNRGLIETSIDGLIAVDPKGFISDVNSQMCRMLACDPEELLGTSFVDCFVDSESAAAGLQETSQKGVITHYLLTLLTKDNKKLSVSLNASACKNPNGEFCGVFVSVRDITGQAQLQMQLSSEHAYNRGLIEASLDGLIAVDPAFTIIDVNGAMCRMLGFTREKLIGTAFPEYFTDTKHATGVILLTLDKNAVTNYELVLRTKEKKEKLLSFNAAIFKDTEGKVHGIFASARDVTEQAQLQKQLVEERAYNRDLIETSVDGLVAVNEAMMITDVNETMCRMVGRARNQLINASFPEYFTEPDRAEEGVKLTFKKSVVTNYVLTLRSFSGNEIPISFNAAIFKDSSGHVRGVLASARNITAQKKLETKLQASQFYARSLIEANIDALITMDLLGIVTDVNHKMMELTGFTREELIKTPFKNYFTDPDRVEEGIRLALIQGRVTDYELKIRGKEGEGAVVSCNVVILNNAEGKLQGIFASVSDITAQKKSEKKLRDQQAYNRGLIESSADGLITVDPKGTITDVNERMCKMTGYGREELMGTPFADYFTEHERAFEGVQRTLAEGIVTEYALTLMARSHRLLQVSINASVFKDPAGKIEGIFASARDVTDRVRLEEKLREQKTYLRGLIESSVDGLITVDSEGFIMDVNEQMCQMAGYTREELIGSLFEGYFTDPQQAKAVIKQTFAQGIVTDYQLILRSKVGKKSTISFNASVFRSVEGLIQGIFASARDISEQAYLQSQLAEQQAYNRSLIEASADALFVIAEDEIITDVNEAAVRLTGYTRKHLINSKFTGYFTEPEQAGSSVKKTLAERRVIGYELVLITHYGRHIIVSFNAGVFTDASGQVRGILAGARDIVAQKELEKQLRNAQLYTRSLIESNIDALITTDPLGNITDVNQQMEILTGYSREELTGKPFKQYFTDPDRAEDGIRLVLKEGKVTNYELTACSKSKQETVVSYNAVTFYDQAGKLQGVFAAARDITERKRFEQTLQEKNVELENANLAKDRFLASMSHELRTPLNAIIGFTGTLLMKLPGPLNAEQDKQLKTVQLSAKHLLSLINDLLDVAKIESGKIELKSESVDCQSIINEVVTSLLPLAKDKGLNFEMILPKEEIIVNADPRALKQILINLSNNAIKFTEKGQIKIELKTREEAGKKFVEINIIDMGIGIKPEDQAKLFQAFQQIDVPGKRAEGTGLGLYLSHKLAVLMHCKIEFESKWGKGSRFSIVLPLE